jgi:hypothetical protein
MRYLFAVILALFVSTANATTYNYVGQPFTSFSGLCSASACSSITGSVTFDFDTSNFSGTIYLSSGDTASLSEGIPGSLDGGVPISTTLSFPSSTVWYNPPYDTYGFSSGITGDPNFTLLNGQIISWSIGGETDQVGCGGGPGCAIGSSDAYSSPSYDGSDIFSYSIERDSSASNNGGGIWTEVAAVPEPSTWAMLLIGFAGIGFVTYRRHQFPKPAGTVSA